MTTRDQLVQAAAEVMDEFWSRRGGHRLTIVEAEAVLDVVEPLIRADKIDPAVRDMFNLTEQTGWSDDGDRDVQDRVNRLARSGPDGLYIGDSSEPATDDELRALGLVKKRRWVGEWEVVDD